MVALRCCGVEQGRSRAETGYRATLWSTDCGWSVQPSQPVTVSVMVVVGLSAAGLDGLAAMWVERRPVARCSSIA